MNSEVKEIFNLTYKFLLLLSRLTGFSYKEINIIIWGGSTRLAGENVEVRKEIKKLLENGVSVEACKACADKMKVAATLKELGVEVKYMSKLTGLIKGDDNLITI